MSKTYDELMLAYLSLTLSQKEWILDKLWEELQDMPELLNHSHSWLVSYVARTKSEWLISLLVQARIGG